MRVTACERFMRVHVSDSPTSRCVSDFCVLMLGKYDREQQWWKVPRDANAEKALRRHLESATGREPRWEEAQANSGETGTGADEHM